MLHLYVVQLLVACDGNRLEESTIDFQFNQKGHIFCHSLDGEKVLDVSRWVVSSFGVSVPSVPCKTGKQSTCRCMLSSLELHCIGELLVFIFFILSLKDLQRRNRILYSIIVVQDFSGQCRWLSKNQKNPYFVFTLYIPF